MFLLALIVLFYQLGGGEYLREERFYVYRGSAQFYVYHHPLLSILVYLGVYISVAALCIPGATAFLTLVGGFLFGLWGGTVLAEIASTIGAMIAFLMARYLFREWVQQLLGDRLQKMYGRLRKEGIRYILAVRLTTAFPYFMLNPLLAISPLSASTFLWTTALGVFPTTVIYAYIGHHFGVVKAHPIRDLIVVLLLPLGVVVCLWPLAKVFLRVKNQGAGT